MSLFNFYDGLTARLRSAGDYVWPTVLRLIMFWEFWESGITKYRGKNWFADIPWADWQKGFPWPVDQLPLDFNWFLATWGELVLGFFILFGLFTRFAAISLIVFTAVATAAVHWPNDWASLAGLWEGYLITSKGAGNYKLPLLFVVLLLPLVFHGGGKLSLDHLMIRMTRRRDRLDDRTADWQATGLALLVLGFTVVWVEPGWGWPLLGAGMLAIIAPQFISKR